MNIGDKAPEVLGINEKGEEIRLSDYKGKKIVLYFYPKDMTSGCTAQACNGIIMPTYAKPAMKSSASVWTAKSHTRNLLRKTIYLLP